MDNIFKGAAVTGAVSGAVVLSVVAVGFTPAGVVGGSIAAAVQSAFYGGATCGAFSFMQSVGTYCTVTKGAALASAAVPYAAKKIMGK